MHVTLCDSTDWSAWPFDTAGSGAAASAGAALGRDSRILSFPDTDEFAGELLTWFKTAAEGVAETADNDR